MEIIKQAAKEGAMAVYTLADPSMAESAKLACNVNDDKESEAKSLGFSEEVRSNYSEMDYVREELKFAPMVFAQNPVRSDRKAIEETSAVILRIYHDRQHKCSTPRITKRC
uniref:Uncharacterized protein n=1 Tax=Populus trichocarpa TaxID=3694 RepID=A0A2K1YER1_POPTR